MSFWAPQADGHTIVYPAESGYDYDLYVTHCHYDGDDAGEDVNPNTDPWVGNHDLNPNDPWWVCRQNVWEVNTACGGDDNDDVVCVDDDNPCTERYAEPTSPTECACRTRNVADGTSCNDGVSCTESDQCQSGQCRGTVNHDSCDDGNQCTNDICSETNGCHSYPTNGTSLASDGNECTRDVCDGDQEYPPVDNGIVCRDDGNRCTLDVCGGGQCRHKVLTDGTSCTDRNVCNGAEICSAGQCGDAPDIVCGASDECHDAGTCNPTTGLCSYPEKPDDTVIWTEVWGDCGGFTTTCGRDGIQTRDKRVCIDGKRLTLTDRRSCNRETNGVSCGDSTDNACTNPDKCFQGYCAAYNEPNGKAVSGWTSWSDCGVSANDPCDANGTQYHTQQICSGGKLKSQIKTQSCTREIKPECAIDDCQPQTEECDGVDNDCDKEVDEGDVCNPPAPACEDLNPDDELSSTEDADGDGLMDACDNCPDDSNEDQADEDEDGEGNICDNACLDGGDQDSDQDGLDNECDNCPNVSDSQQDDDMDKIGDDCDNCPNNSNPDQTDTNGDGIGDACEPEPLPSPDEEKGSLQVVDIPVTEDACAATGGEWKPVTGECYGYSMIGSDCGCQLSDHSSFKFRYTVPFILFAFLILLTHALLRRVASESLNKSPPTPLY